MTNGVGGADATHGRPAPLARRLACMSYEAMLLFGVLMTVGLLYAMLTDQRHALRGATGLQLTLFVVLGAYFAYFWSRGRQTLPMKTWRIAVVRSDGAALGIARAGCRYVASWLWFLPALATLQATGVRNPGAAAIALATGMSGYVMLARLRRDRRFLHDVLCGTRLVDLRPPPIEPAQSPA